MKKTIKITDLEAIVKQAHEKVKNLKGGKNADYIPFLAKIDPNLFRYRCLSTHGRSHRSRRYNLCFRYRIYF